MLHDDKLLLTKSELALLTHSFYTGIYILHEPNSLELIGNCAASISVQSFQTCYHRGSMLIDDAVLLKLNYSKSIYCMHTYTAQCENLHC